MTVHDTATRIAYCFGNETNPNIEQSTNVLAVGKKLF
jgi:hypothetical protein